MKTSTQVILLFAAWLIMVAGAKIPTRTWNWQQIAAAERIAK